MVWGHCPLIMHLLVKINLLSSLQKGDLFTTETTEITETKDNFIFSQK
jgi:hypothetical protein